MTYRLIPGVTCARIYDAYFLIASLEARSTVDPVRELNETGAYFWKKLETGADFGEIISQTTQEYEVSAEDAKAAFEAFAAALCDAGYLIMEEEPA